MRKTLSLFVTCVAITFCATQLFAANQTVGSCAGPGIHYTTIQAAVDAAATGSIVDVCPGTYPEEVHIYKSLTLQGLKSGVNDAAIITIPAGGAVQNTTEFYNGGFPLAAQIDVEPDPNVMNPPAITVTISHMVVDGSNNQITQGCGLDLIGIYYKNASGTITQNAVRNQILPPATFGCQNGQGIYAENDSGSPSLTITSNSVRNYDKNGITVNGPGTGAPGYSFTMKQNSVVGVGATDGIAQNGIQIAYGATGTIAGNYVADDIYTGGGYASSGILVYASNNLTMNTNTVTSAQLGIVTASDPNIGTADNNQITGNHINGTVNFDGIDLCSNNNTAKNNVIYGSDESGVHVDDECFGPGMVPTGTGNTVMGNKINEACAGVLLGSASSVGVNTYSNVGYTTLSGDTCSYPAPAAAASATVKKRSARRASPRLGHRVTE